MKCENGFVCADQNITIRGDFISEKEGRNIRIECFAYSQGVEITSKENMLEKNLS